MNNNNNNNNWYHTIESLQSFIHSLPAVLTEIILEYCSGEHYQLFHQTAKHSYIGQLTIFYTNNPIITSTNNSSVLPALEYNSSWSQCIDYCTNQSFIINSYYSGIKGPFIVYNSINSCIYSAYDLGACVGSNSIFIYQYSIQLNQWSLFSEYIRPTDWADGQSIAYLRAIYITNNSNYLRLVFSKDRGHDKICYIGIVELSVVTKQISCINQFTVDWPANPLITIINNSNNSNNNSNELYLLGGDLLQFSRIRGFYSKYQSTCRKYNLNQLLNNNNNNNNNNTNNNYRSMVVDSIKINSMNIKRAGQYTNSLVYIPTLNRIYIFSTDTDSEYYSIDDNQWSIIQPSILTISQNKKLKNLIAIALNSNNNNNELILVHFNIDNINNSSSAGAAADSITLIFNCLTNSWFGYLPNFQFEEYSSYSGLSYKSALIAI